MVQSGLDGLIADGFSALKGKRVGVLTHPASVDCSYVHLLDRFAAAGVDVKAIFGPEHGFLGHVQDMITVDAHETHPRFQCPIYSLYGSGEASLSPQPQWFSGLDVLVIDLQDIGSRYYTFVWTAVLCMRVAAATKTPLLVLDRPNPLGGEVVEGGGVDAGFHSFVGLYDVPVRHGMSVGEMLRLVRAEEKLDVEVEVIKAPGWKREAMPKGYAWVYPSPNMPTFDTALVYPGMCLLEATNASEGRGTTRPFEVFGAGYVDAGAFARALDALNEPGVVWRPLSFLPTFQKFGGKLCGGVQLHVTDARVFKPFRAGLRATRVLSTMAEFQWRKEPYEFVSDRNAFDLLTGTSKYREALGSDAALVAVYDVREARCRSFEERRAAALIY
jgi:uncharacterized protein YbbC (DUF1343 family)